MTDEKNTDAPATETAADQKAPETGSPSDERVAALEAQVGDLKDQLLRTLADMENLRRRTEREIADTRSYAGSSVARDILSINPSSLRAELERSPYAKLFIWTGEKVLFWSQLTSFVGLVLRLDRSLEVLVAPQPLFLLKVLRWCAPAQVGPFQLFDLLDTTDRTLFACFTERGRVHSGLAYSLTALDRLGHVRLTHSADAARSLLLDQWRVSNIEFVSREDPL